MRAKTLLTMALGLAVAGLGVAWAGERGEDVPLVERLRALEGRVAALEAARAAGNVEAVGDGARPEPTPASVGAAEAVPRDREAGAEGGPRITTRHLVALDVLLAQWGQLLHGRVQADEWAAAVQLDQRQAWAELAGWMDAGQLGWSWPQSDDQLEFRSGFGAMLVRLPRHLQAVGRAWRANSRGAPYPAADRLTALADALRLLQWPEAYAAYKALVRETRAQALEGARTR